MITDMETYLTGDILAKVDRASMAHGLEVRNPLLDQNFVTAALQIACRARPGKFLLKQMLAKRMPRQFVRTAETWVRDAGQRLVPRTTSPYPRTLHIFVKNSSSAAC